MAKLNNLPSMAYWLIKYLSENADENFWKLLKYNDIDALDHPNLTKDEKLNMIHIAQSAKDATIFLTPVIPDAEPDDRTIMKIYNYDILPYNNTSVYVRWSLEFLVGNDSVIAYNTAGEPAARTDLLINYALQALDNKQIGGVGPVNFMSKRSNSYGAAFIGESRSYVGYRILIQTIVDCVNGCGDCV